MKIGDIQVGSEYAIHDSPSRGPRFYEPSDNPRHARVEEIVTEAERIRSRTWTTSPGTRNVKKVRVTILDPGTAHKTTWSRDRIRNADEGDVLIIETRQVIAPWEELKDDIKKRVEWENARTTKLAEYEDRLEALLGKSRGSARDQYRVSVSRSDGAPTASLHISDKALDKLLGLAEKGKA